MASGLTNAVKTDTQLSGEDIGVVVAYFVVVIGIGIFASCRAQKGTLSGYFLAGRKMWFISVAASLFVSNIGSEHFIGLAGSGAAGGISVGAWEFNAILLLQLLGFVFVPIYIACRVYTMPEYLHKRFGGKRLRIYFTCLSLVLYIFTKCSVDLYTGALFIQQSLGWDLYLSIFVLLVIVAILTITGGLTAVIYTDTLQAALMVFGACFLTYKGFEKVGGFDGLWREYPCSMPEIHVPNTTCHVPNEKWDVMLRELDDPDMPWLGFLLGQTPGSIWYWCADQVIVQRALAAKSLSHAQAATLMAGFLKILPLFIMVMPGMISRVLYANEVACVDPDECFRICQSRAGCTNIAYPKLVLGVMGTGWRGLMMAVMIAALMSDLDSIFNSASTLFTIDIWKRLRKHCSLTEQMVVGRVFIVAMTGVAIAWVPVIKEIQGGQIFIYIQEITNYLAPPVATLFLMAIFLHFVNEQGAFWGLICSLVAGLIRLIMVLVYKTEGSCGEENNAPSILDMHYMYFALLLCIIQFVTTTIISLLTERPHPKFLWKTTFWTRYETRSYEDALRRYKSTAMVQTHDNPSSDIIDEEDIGVVVPNTRSFSTQCDLTNSKVFTISNDESKTAEEMKNGNSYTLSEEQNETKVSSRAKAWFLKWLCGIGATSEQDAKNDETWENKISNLEQNQTVKKLLYSMVCVILVFGVVLYCFWSLWSYDYPNGGSNNVGQCENLDDLDFNMVNDTTTVMP